MLKDLSVQKISIQMVLLLIQDHDLDVTFVVILSTLTSSTDSKRAQV